MASFFEDLWTSVFTAGPTPTLLIATNVTFAALQLVLLALLLVTYSIHFIVLSFLCAGLWVSINWFAAEIQKGNEEAARAKAADAKQRGSSEDSGTETEDAKSTSSKRLKRDKPSGGLATGIERAGDADKRRSFNEVESTDSECDKVESEVDA